MARDHLKLLDEHMAGAAADFAGAVKLQAEQHESLQPKIVELTKTADDLRGQLEAAIAGEKPCDIGVQDRYLKVMGELEEARMGSRMAFPATQEPGKYDTANRCNDHPSAPLRLHYLRGGYRLHSPSHFWGG